MAYDAQGETEFDVSPLQKAFLTLAAKVDQCAKENAALRAEIAELRVGKRLEALEQGLQELAEAGRPAGLFWSQPQSGNGRDGVGGPLAHGDHSAAGPGGPALAGASARGPAGGAGGPAAGGSVSGGSQPGGAVGASDSWVVQEVLLLRERQAAMERKSEALWHGREDDEQLRSAVERLRQDILTMQGSVAEAQGGAAAANQLAERQAAATSESVLFVKDLQDRVHNLEVQVIKGTEERREMASKYESSVGQIWDQLRHVESSLSQRLTMAETSHVAALQEVDEAKEATNEVLQRVDDVKRHTSALEGKLESFNTQVAAAINPLHNALAAAGERLEALAASKQDAATAIKQADVELGVARAIEHADRRGDNLLKAIAGIEARLESLAESTPNKGEVVLTADLEALLTAHAAELDVHLEALKDGLMTSMAQKVDRDELNAMDSRVGGRLEGLETALLRGLRAISDKASAALAEKLDLAKFSEFKLQVRAILADVEDRLRDWSPLAFGTKAQLGTDALTAGAAGAPSCLCCDSRVRSVRDLRAMGFRDDDRVFVPDRVPSADPLLPAIQGNRAATLGAHLNARLNHRNANADAKLKSTASLIEALPTTAWAGGAATGSSGGAGSGGGAVVAGTSGGATTGSASAAGNLAAAVSAVDAGSFAALPPAATREDRLGSAGQARTASARGIKVKVETVAGNIMKGQLPGRHGGGGSAGGTGGDGGGRGSAGTTLRTPRSPVAAASTATGIPSHLGQQPGPPMHQNLMVVGGHGGHGGNSGSGGSVTASSSATTATDAAAAVVAAVAANGPGGGGSGSGSIGDSGAGGGGEAEGAMHAGMSPWRARSPSPLHDDAGPT